MERTIGRRIIDVFVAAITVLAIGIQGQEEQRQPKKKILYQMAGCRLVNESICNDVSLVPL
jgi:hypothetical protein